MKYRLMITLLLAFSLGTAGVRAGEADISGIWTLSVDLEGGPQDVQLTLVLEQKGGALRGTQSGGLGDNDVAGTLEGNRVTLSGEGKTKSGQPFRISYIGEIESSTKMTGTLTFFKGVGKWSAVRK
jgi:hypothetical protein